MATARKAAARRTADQVRTNTARAAEAPPYPRISIGTAAFDIADLPDEEFASAIGDIGTRSHLHYYCQGFDRQNAQDGTQLDECIEIDTVADSEGHALEIAKRIVPSRRYFRVHHVTVHEPRGDSHV